MTEYSLYGGQHVLRFDPDKHVYYYGNTKNVVPGVTSITGVMDKPALIYWAVNQTVEFLQTAIQPGQPYDEVHIAAMLKAAKNARFSTSNKATTIGSLVHDWIEKYIKYTIKHGQPPVVVEADPDRVRRPGHIGIPFNEDAARAIDQFLKWEKKNKVEYIFSERKTFSPTHWYAGTCDIGAIINGKRTVLDWKTSKDIYEDYFIQVSAYAKALEEEGDEPYEQIMIVQVPKDGKEFKAQAKPHKRTPEKDINFYFELFLQCRGIYAWKNEKPKDIVQRPWWGRPIIERTPELKLAA